MVLANTITVLALRTTTRRALATRATRVLKGAIDRQAMKRGADVAEALVTLLLPPYPDAE
jgi:hypothetical protein